MNYINKRYIHIILMILISGLLSSCSKPKKYQIGITAVSEQGYGVIINKIIPHTTAALPIKIGANNFCKLYIYPTTSVEHANATWLNDFKGVPHDQLPNYITFEYQLAAISECSVSRKDKTIKLQFLQDYKPYQKGDTVVMRWELAEYYLKRTRDIVKLIPSIKEIHNSNDTLLKRELEIAKAYYTKSNCKNWNLTNPKKFKKTIDLRAFKKSKKIERFGKQNKSASGSYYGLRVLYQFYDDGEIKLYLENYATNPWK
ncbi:hypothetical protein [Aquimarina pacifica]|uniref:hypothetical protein n=1 Tax=Aquimarina pacifica TaxID=1296415 RepID=UPI000472834B|nr:hypothetical protein [Aquimarina pacifica]